MWWLDPGKEVLNVLFNRILAPYVENLDLNQVNYGIGQGQLTLRSLRLKKGALDKFRLPIDVLEGHLGKFSLSLHWLNLGNQPVEILVEDVYLLVVPSSHNKQDPEEEEQRAQAIKRERLENAELLHLRGEAEKSGDQQPQGFWESLIAKVVNNLQISVKNIHIRYEDKHSVPNHPFVAGVTLDGFTAISVNDNWEPAFIESAAGAIHKLAKLESLAIYFDTDVKRLESDKKDSVFRANATKETQDTAAPTSTHQYILNPVSGEGRITINRKADPRTPRLDVQLFLDTIGVAVDDSQYRDTILLLDAYHVYMRKHQYRKYWPQDEANNLARSRLLFAGNAVLGSVRERRRQWTWPFFAERRDDRNRYIELFERKVVGNLSPNDTRDIEKLEKKLSYEDIRFYRSIARSRLRKDEALRKRLQAEQAPPQPAKQSWTSWIWGSAEPDKKQDENAFNQPMTESQKKELYDVIDFDERNALAESFESPRDAVKALFSLKLNQGIFALRTSPHLNPQELTSISFQEFHASFLQRTDNFEASISLGDFSIRDGILENTIHKKIVSVKNKELAIESSESLDQDDEPFFYANFEKNPLDERADSALTVKMRSVQVVYHRGYVEAIYKFFQAPASHLESVEALLSAASQTFEGFRKETRAGLEHALQTHKTIDVRMDLNAPVIIIPEDVTSSKCKHLIIDAGHISVESDLAKKDALREIQMKRKKAYSEKDYKQLESLMYDRFSLKLGAAQFVLGNDFNACLNALLPDSKDNLHLLERINIDLQVHNSIVPSVADLPRIKVAGKLPLLQLNFSDIKYKALMRLIDVSIPNFGGDELEKRPALTPTDHKSFQLSTGFFSNTGTEYNVEDHDDSKDMTDDNDQETFFEAEDGGDKVPEGRQHKFDLSFQVDELRASVSRSTSNEEERLLGDLVLQRFSLEFALTELDMTVDVDLRSLSLDLIQPGSKPLRFLSSVEDKDNTTEDLMIVHYSRVQRTAPDFISKHEGFDQTVEVKLSTFIFTALPEPIISLYDFIMTTFVPSNNPPPITEGTGQPSNSDNSQVDSQQPVESKIRVLVELASVQLRLISGDEALATLCLSTANVSVILSKTLRVVGRLGNLALSNDMHSHRVLPEFNNILSIEGEELAEFRYQTFDPESEEYNGIKSSVFLHTASLKLHFLAEPIHEILVFLSKLAKLKGLYDAATQAAVQTASNVDVGGMQFDLSIKTPILVYPRDPTESHDILVMQLGEINVKNALQENENKTSGTLNGILLVSTTYNGGQPSSLKIIENIDINADVIQNMTSSRHIEDIPMPPDMQISVKISDVKLHLTQIQYNILLALASSVSSVMTSTHTEAIQYDPSESVLTPIPLKSENAQATHNVTADAASTSTPSSLDLIVSVNAISLHLYDKHATAKESLKEHGIAKFALIDNSLRLKTLRDGSTEAQLILRSFTVVNTRPGGTRFREIVPSAQHDRNQFMVLYTIPNNPDVPPVGVVTIDAPQIIFAIDPLMALIDFFSTKEVPAPSENTQQPQTMHGSAADEPKVEPTQRLNFRLELHELSVCVLQNDSDPETHCVKLFVHHLLISQQAVTTLSIERMGMSLTRLGKLPESVRFLDDVDLTLSLNSSTSATQQFTSIEATVKPVIFRASYGDIMLISSIVQRAIESYGQLGTADMDSPTDPAASTLPQEYDKGNQTKGTNASGNARVSLSKEQLTASFDGLRLILIGDLYEQPLLHLKLNPFILGAKDWSGELHATTTMAMQINYWNLLNSHWEPLIDPWTFTLTATRDGASEGTNFGLAARDRLDLNVSTTLVEFANTASSIWAKEGSQVLQKPRGTYAPYRLRNRTGSTVVVWADDNQSGTKDINTVKIVDNQTVDWRFDGWKTTREHVSSGGQHSLCLQFIDKDWERLRGIPVDREGEFVFSMRPRSKYPNRLLVEVKVIDAVKIVTIRSTYQVENHTLYPLELMLVNESGHPIHSMERIVPGESFPLPIDVASSSRIRVQPDQGFGYKWCQAIRWEDLIARKSFTIKCPHTQPDEAAFRFQAFVQTDARELTSRAFPKISLKLRAPLELENLLPYNLEYRIYDKDTDQNWRSYLRKGGVMPVHSVELSHFVLLNVFLQDTVFHASEFAIINTDGHSDFDIESRITLRDQRNRKLDLRLNYVRYPDSGGAFRVQIYSPVIFVNKTGLPFFIKTTRSTRAGSQDVAGDDRFDSLAEPSPYLASHPYDNGHEYILKVGHSAWSKTISLEAPTAESALVIPSEKYKSEEIHVGVSWSEGRGKYKLTKIVTLTPRFLLKNNLSEPISYREHGYPPREKSTLQPGERIPLQFIRAGDEKLLTIAYPGLNSQWSAPINIEDIGSVHLRLRSSREGTSSIPLVRSDVHVDTSTIFVTFSQASEWPFLIENKSDYSVTLSQTGSGQNPDQVKRSNPTYPIQPGTDLEYAWDFPAARDKKVLLVINGAPRVVDIMEIGNLMPFKFHDKKSSKAVSLDVRAAGQQQILRISNYHPDRSVYKPRNRNIQSISRQDTISSAVEFEPIAETASPTLSLSLNMAGIGISLMNRKMVEVLYASIDALKLEYTSSPVAQSFNVSCGTLQIDNQLHDALYPVLLQPTPINKESTGVAALPTIQGSIIWLNDQDHGVLFIKYCSILLQALTIECDEDLLFALIDLVKVQGLSWEESDDSLMLDDIKTIPEPSRNSGGEELYFEVLELQPIKLLLSFMRTERVSTEAKSSIRNPVAVALNAFTMAVGNINDAPLEMNALGLKDMHLTMPELTARISYHYRQEVLRQLYRLLGSADFIGNPVGLFTNVSSGVADIFYEPFHGNVMHGNKELGLGIAKGAASFVKKTVFGLSDSVTKFTGSVGKGLSAATFDPEYQARRRIAQRRNKPRHAIYGVAAGGEAFASSVTSAVEGVLMKPIEGAEQEGAVGFFKGIGKGIVGAVTKPVVGVFDLASNVSEGIRNTTTVFDNPERDRVRLPRYVSADGVLKPYNAREALGQYWMRDLNNGAYRQEAYVAHINSAGDEKVVLLTRQRVLSFWVKNLRLEWDLPFSDVHGITVEDTGIRFGHKAGKDQDRFAFIPDKSSQSWFFGQLSTVVKAFNARKRMDV